MGAVCDLPADHLDLLVTAADLWGVIGGPAAGHLPAQGVPAVRTTEQAGMLLRTEHVLAREWLAVQGRTPLADLAVLPGYSFRSVDHVEPVEVIKACHAYEHVTGTSPGWDGSLAQRFVRAVLTAAEHRLEGYDLAPWLWTRPQVRSGPAVGFGGAWRPPVAVRWVDVADLERDWSTASLVVVTAEVAHAVPAWLPRRGGLFVVADRSLDDQLWTDVDELGPEVMLFWPAGAAWLEEQLRHPEPRFTRHRPFAAPDLAPPTS